jgi:hypothetical protein
MTVAQLKAILETLPDSTTIEIEWQNANDTTAVKKATKITMDMEDETIVLG